MAELTIDLTYANALFQAAKELDKIELIAEESHELAAVFDREPGLCAFINTPTIGAVEKKQALNNIFQGRICDELLNLLYILVDKGRTKHFKKIVAAYTELMNKEEGYAYGKIISVKPLRPEQLEKFEEETGRLMRQKVKLENETDPSIIGGVKIFVDGKVIDASIRSRLKNLEATIN